MKIQSKNKARGFSLIELLVIIILLSIASVSLVSMFGQLGGNLAVNHDINASAQMAQECAEYLLVQRRENGYAMNGITDCSAIADFNGNTPPTVTIDAAYTGAGCPSLATCKLITVSGAYDSGGATVDFVVVDY